MFKNKITGAILTDEEYRDLREKEAVTLWNELTPEEKEEWGSFEKFKEYDFWMYPDQDFVYIECDK